MKIVRVVFMFCACVGGTAMAGEFHGTRCTQDCSGHRAGYAWAARKGITEPEECGGNSRSFREGCRAYAEEQVEKGRAAAAEEERPPAEPVKGKE